MSNQDVRLEDLAKIAGVSIATVSRALNNSHLVREDTKKRIWQLARDHNYGFRPQMPAILSSASSRIVLAIPTPLGRVGSLADPFFMELIGGIGEAARELECDMTISHISPQNFDGLSSIISTSRADGVIFLGQSFLHERYNRLTETDSRFVVWGGELPGQRYCSIGSDNVRGGYRATKHLIRLGRKHIAFFGDTEAPEIMQRYQGYADALQEAGIEISSDLVIPLRFTLESAESTVDRLLAQNVEIDGVFATNDIIAIGAMRSLIARGRSVPEDVSVVGYDNLMVARMSRPGLTTISQDMAKAGRLLVSKVLNATDPKNMRSERLPTDLIIRGSCGA